jgi:hypothetical protein
MQILFGGKSYKIMHRYCRTKPPTDCSSSVGIVMIDGEVEVGGKNSVAGNSPGA